MPLPIGTETHFEPYEPTNIAIENIPLKDAPSRRASLKTEVSASKGETATSERRNKQKTPQPKKPKLGKDETKEATGKPETEKKHE